MGNLPILYRNVMSAMRTEMARTAFLWATDKVQNDRYCYVAEAFAREVDRLAPVIWHLIGHGAAKHGASGRVGAKIDLFVFIMRRHAHFRFPGNNEAWL